MRKALFTILAIFTFTLLAGCSTDQTMFGVPASEWNKLTPEQQNMVLNGYYKKYCGVDDSDNNSQSAPPPIRRRPIRYY